MHVLTRASSSTRDATRATAPLHDRPAGRDREAVSVAPENIALGAGSWEILRTSVRLFTSSSRHLVTAAPSFENPEKMAEQLGVGVRKVPVSKDGRLDLEGMAQAAKWAGLIFFCNPNNPTSTLHPAKAVAEFVARIHKESPDTVILIDEAYHDYVTDPAYATSVPLALENPNVVVARTLSKAYGMAGMRVGYAVGQPRTIENFNRWAITFNQNSLAVAAAIAALGDPAHIDAEAPATRRRAHPTTRFFDSIFGRKVMGLADQLRVRGDGPPRARISREACAKRGLIAGGPFPPLETGSRASIGTIEEMQKAGPVTAESFRRGRHGQHVPARGAMSAHRKETVMALTRRSFIEAVGIGGAGLLATPRGAWASLLEGAPATRGGGGAPSAAPPQQREPPGPGGLRPPGRVLRPRLRRAGRPYPWEDVNQLHKASPTSSGVAPENVITGPRLDPGPARGRAALRPRRRSRWWPASSPTKSREHASLIGTPVRAIPLDKSLQLDLEAMAEAAKGAGLVFLNNPNNPTGGVLSGDAVDRFIEHVFEVAPGSAVMIDEAYHDYVTDPSHRTQVPRAVKDPRVIVARTFSKAHGMAGMRMGYAIGHPDTIKQLDWEGPMALNVAGIVAATASINDQARLDREKARNTEARASRSTGSPGPASPRRTPRPTSSSWTSSARRRRSATPAASRACCGPRLPAAREEPRAASRSARSTEMKRAIAVFGKVLGVKAKAA